MNKDPTELFASLRFQLGALLGHLEWYELPNEEFARKLYVEISRLTAEHGEFSRRIEHATAVLSGNLEI